MKALENKNAPQDAIAHDVEPLTVKTDTGPYARVGWIIVLVGVLGFLLWAVLAPLDKGVPLSGFVAKESNRKTIQPAANGIVETVLVKDGDRVKAGQVLVRMNAIQAQSAAETSRAQYIADLAIEARLLAERDGKSAIAFPAELTALKGDPRAVQAMALQQQLMSSRRLALESELAAMDASIAGLQQQIAAVTEARESKKEQLTILKEQFDNMRDLAKDGYVARSRMLDVQRTYMQMSAAIVEDTGVIARSRGQLSEARLHRSQRVQDFQREVRGNLADAQKEVEMLRSRLAGQDFELANTEVRSPVDGVVTGLAVFTPGAVVGAGTHLMEVVPSNDALVVEGQLAVNLIDKVHVGLQTELLFPAFNSNRTPHIPGEVIQVAADRTLDERTGQPYYKVRARVTPEGSRLIARHHLQIQPGMPVEMFVKTGERSMMSYLLKPVFDRAKTSMSED